MTRLAQGLLLAFMLPALMLPDGGYCLCRGMSAVTGHSCCAETSARSLPPCCRARRAADQNRPMAKAVCKGCLNLATGLGRALHHESQTGPDLASTAALPAVFTPILAADLSRGPLPCSVPAPESPPGRLRSLPILI